MHPPLPRELVNEILRPVFLLQADETLEEGMAAILQSDFPEQRLCNLGRFLGLLHDSRQLFVVADENKLVDGIPSPVLRGKYAQQVRLQDLRGFVDDSQFKMFQREEVKFRGYGRRRPYEHPRLRNHPPDGCRIGASSHFLSQQLVVEACITRKPRPDADKPYPMLLHLLANLVHRPIRVGHQEDGGPFFRQRFLHHRHQCVGGLARPRRTDQQEVVVGLLGLQQKGAERDRAFIVAAVQPTLGIAARLPDVEQEVPSLLARREEGIESTVERGIGGFHKIVLERPDFVFREDTRVPLRETQLDGYLLRQYLADAPAQDFRFVRLRLRPRLVGIEDNDVARPEIREEVFALRRDGEGDDVEAPSYR